MANITYPNKTTLNAKGGFSIHVKRPVQLENFSYLSIRQTLQRDGWAILTGTREANGNHASEANTRANDRLELLLKRNRLNFSKVGGFYRGIDQGSNFLVAGITTEEAVSIGCEFGQESVLTREGLMMTNSAIIPADHSKTVIGEKALKEEFYSRLPGGVIVSIRINF